MVTFHKEVLDKGVQPLPSFSIIKGLMFADDVVIVANTFEEMMEINPSKCGLMAIIENCQSGIEVASGIIPVVETYTYI